MGDGYDRMVLKEIQRICSDPKQVAERLIVNEPSSHRNDFNACLSQELWNIKQEIKNYLENAENRSVALELISKCCRRPVDALIAETSLNLQHNKRERSLHVVEPPTVAGVVSFAKKRETKPAMEYDEFLSVENFDVAKSSKLPHWLRQIPLTQLEFGVGLESSSSERSATSSQRSEEFKTADRSDLRFMIKNDATPSIDVEKLADLIAERLELKKSLHSVEIPNNAKVDSRSSSRRTIEDEMGREVVATDSMDKAILTDSMDKAVRSHFINAKHETKVDEIEAGSYRSDFESPPSTASNADLNLSAADHPGGTTLDRPLDLAALGIRVMKKPNCLSQEVQTVVGEISSGRESQHSPVAHGDRNAKRLALQTVLQLSLSNATEQAVQTIAEIGVQVAPENSAYLAATMRSGFNRNGSASPFAETGGNVALANRWDIDQMSQPSSSRSVGEVKLPDLQESLTAVSFIRLLNELRGRDDHELLDSASEGELQIPVGDREGLDYDTHVETNKSTPRVYELSSSDEDDSTAKDVTEISEDPRVR